MDDIISRNGSKAELRKAAYEKGFKTMKDDGILKVLEGVTTLQSLATAVDINK